MKLCDEAIHCACSDKYEKLFKFVHYIANDYTELSADKIRWQRDDYVRMAKKLLDVVQETTAVYRKEHVVRSGQ